MINPKPGDMVLIARKPTRNEDPLCLWYSDMDTTVGTIGYVRKAGQYAWSIDGYVTLEVGDTGDDEGPAYYLYPLACLEYVEEKLQPLAEPEFESAIASLFGVVP